MLTRIQRDVAAEEQEFFSNARKRLSKPSPNIVLIAALITVGAIAGGMISQFLYPYVAESSVLAMLYGGIAGAIMAIIIQGAQKKTQIAKENEDFRPQKMEVLHCQSEAVIHVEEFEDEGPHYFFETGEGEILYLSGQYLYDDVENGKFPSTEFEILRIPKSGMVYNIECLGKPLKPLKVIETSGKFSIIKDIVDRLEDGQVFSGRLETLQEDIKRISR